MRAVCAITPDLVVTLVHGTWPRGWLRDVFLTLFYGAWPSASGADSLWFAETSDFRSRLTDALGRHGLSAQISSFLWSGANSVRERDAAAQNLAERIRTERLTHPNSTQLLVAHSHGGNVVLRALGQLAVAHDDLFIATLATPFVEILPASLFPKDRARTEDLLALFVGMLILFSSTPVTEALRLPYVLQLVVLLFVGLGGGWLFVLWLRRWRTKNAAKVDELVGLTSISPHIRKHPTLVLRAVDDEASLTLAAAAIGNRLSTLLANWSVVIFALLVAGAAILILVLHVGANVLHTEPFLSSWKRFEAFSIPSLRWFLPLALFVFVFAPGAFKSGYGREFLLNANYCDINSQSVPDTVDRQSETKSTSELEPSNWRTVITLNQTADARTRLRHGLYEHPQCVDRIADWLKSELAHRK